MTDSRQAWEQAGQSFEQLGTQLREHYSRVGAERGAGEVDDALRRFTDSVDAAVKAVGDAVRDPGFQESARAAARALGDALTATFEQVGGTVRGHLGRHGGEDDRAKPS